MNEDKLDVYAAIENLGRHLVELHGAVRGLRDRLEPVLSPNVTKGVEDKGVEDKVEQVLVRTPLAEAIDVRSSEVAVIHDVVKEALERLQI